MTYQYKVIHDSNSANLNAQFNLLGKQGWRVISVTWDYDTSTFIAFLEHEK